MSRIDTSKCIGCLVGGAAGDALGYPVEFMKDFQIVSAFGEMGITEYFLHNGNALISDDTQMTLFTACGLLNSKLKLQGGYDEKKCIESIADSYVDWLNTQIYKKPVSSASTWLANDERFYSQRAPGNTCIESISEFKKGIFGSIENPVNNSKGCGGVMRVAPIGLWGYRNGLTAKETALLAAKAAALTHGHELGYIPAAALAYIIYEILNGKTLLNSVNLALSAVKEMFSDNSKSDYFIRTINRATELASSKRNSLLCIDSLGAGWVAEEALAIAIFCSLRFSDNFEKAVISAVNHSGDSDSTGAITGNILGAYLGVDAIPEKFIANLELYSLITTVAEDLAESEISKVDAYEEKYIAKTFSLL